MSIELDNATLDQFELEHEWVDVTYDPPPHGHPAPEKRYKCFVRAQVKASWKVGELALGRLTADRGNDLRTVPNKGDFNKLKTAQLPSGDTNAQFYVGSSYLTGFRRGGVVEFQFEVMTQTTKGESELRKEDGRIVDRVSKSTVFRKVIEVPPPPT